MAKYSQEVSRFVDIYRVSLRDIGRNGMGMFSVLCFLLGCLKIELKVLVLIERGRGTHMGACVIAWTSSFFVA